MARQAKITALPTQPVLEKLLTLKEVAQLLQVDRTEVYRLIEKEHLPIVPFGEKGLNRRVRPGALARWLEQREESRSGV
jgi:excisionase family DNA binding protein